MAVEHEREILTWATFGEATRSLATDVAASGWEPDLVLAVARGGLTVGGALGYALGVKNCAAVSVEYYTGVDARLDVPVFLPPVPDPVVLADLRVLVADDVADTGHTLAAVLDFCSGAVADVRSAVLFHKPRSVVVPDYSWKRTDGWIVFPWSAHPPVTGGGGEQ